MAPTFLFFSGGTALNAIESIFKLFTDSVYVLPISDNGGSSSVIMDVIGGPSIGGIFYTYFIHLLLYTFCIC